MKKNAGYCLSLDGDDSFVLKVGSGDGKPYKLEWARRFPAVPENLDRQTSEIAKSRSSVVQLLPGQDVSLMTVMLPGMSSKMLSASLRGIMANEKGGSSDDWIVDFKSGPGRSAVKGGESRSRVTAVFAGKELVAGHWNGARELGCEPEAILPGYLALEQLLRRNNPEIIEGGGWILVYLGKKERFLCVGDEEELLLSRILPEDLSGGVEEEEYLGKLVVEIERSNFFAKQAESSIEVRRLVICGEPGMADKLANMLSEKASQEVVRWRPEDLFSAGEGAKPHSNVLMLAAAAGVLHGFRYNLLPPDGRRSVCSRVRRKSTIAVSALAAGILPALLIGGLWTSRVQNGFLRDAEERLNDLRKRSALAAEAYVHNHALKECQANIDEFGGGQQELAKVLGGIAVRTPGKIVFDAMDVGNDPGSGLRLTLRGRSVARNGEIAQRAFLGFLESLDRYKGLKKTREPLYVEIAGEEDDEGKTNSRVAFTLEYLIVGGKGE